MKEEIRVLISEEDLYARIRELADRINRDYEGKELHLLCTLKGAVFVPRSSSMMAKPPRTAALMMMFWIKLFFCRSLYSGVSRTERYSCFPLFAPLVPEPPPTTRDLLPCLAAEVPFFVPVYVLCFAINAPPHI